MDSPHGLETSESLIDCLCVPQSLALHGSLAPGTLNALSTQLQLIHTSPMGQHVFAHEVSSSAVAADPGGQVAAN
eukprot:4658537-Pyramimonas_sp.AAC.1